MNINLFTHCSKPVNKDEFDFLEEKIGYRLPSEFKAHYEKWNGGVPTLDWFPMKDDWEPIWINSFLPIEASEEIRSIAGTYEHAIKKRILPPNFLPFSLDHGGNFFCLNMDNGNIHYHLNDAWDSSLSMESNQEKANRYLTSSFAKFMESLVSEDQAFE